MNSNLEAALKLLVFLLGPKEVCVEATRVVREQCLPCWCPSADRGSGLLSIGQALCVFNEAADCQG
jgi:hypothetical protein